jgi:frataxin-like iron-binding protein CyaY
MRAFSYRSLCTARAISRKSRRGSTGPIDLGSNFKDESSKLFVSIKRALQPLVPLNEGFQLQDEDATGSFWLDMGVKGCYVFSKDFDNEQVNVQSPVSGMFAYYFDAETKTWLSRADGHDFRGLVTRDILRHCIGCPQF